MRDDVKKCKDCRWLNLKRKTTVGFVCECPNITHKGLGYLKYAQTPACKKGFEQKKQYDNEKIVRLATTKEEL